MYATNAATAYSNVSASILGSRGIEQRVFEQVNGQLMAVKNNPDASMTQLAEAVHANTKLWTMLAVDVFSDDNSMPETLRAQIASLALYAQKAGRSILRREAPVDELVNINRAIIAGLGGSTGDTSIGREVQ